MNKFLSDVNNRARESNEDTLRLLDSVCDGVTLYQARRISNAVLKIVKASSDLMQIVADIEHSK